MNLHKIAIWGGTKIELPKETNGTGIPKEMAGKTVRVLDNVNNDDNGPQLVRVEVKERVAINGGLDVFQSVAKQCRTKDWQIVRATMSEIVTLQRNTHTVTRDLLLSLVEKK